MEGQDSPFTVRYTQLPLWKVSYCCSNISTLHSYQPWSSERTLSIRRDDFPCRLALPETGTQRCHVSSDTVGPLCSLVCSVVWYTAFFRLYSNSNANSNMYSQLFPLWLCIIWDIKIQSQNLYLRLLFCVENCTVASRKLPYLVWILAYWKSTSNSCNSDFRLG